MGEGEELRERILVAEEEEARKSEGVERQRRTKVQQLELHNSREREDLRERSLLAAHEALEVAKRQWPSINLTK